MNNNQNSRISVANLLNPVNQSPRSESPITPQSPRDTAPIPTYGSPPPENIISTKLSRPNPGDAPRQDFGPRYDERDPGTQPLPLQPQPIFDQRSPDGPPRGSYGESRW
jgi:hypothetical protein